MCKKINFDIEMAILSDFWQKENLGLSEVKKLGFLWC